MERTFFPDNKDASAPHEPLCQARSDTIPKLPVLRKIRAFSTLTDADLSEMARHLKVRQVEKGNVLSLDDQLSQRICFAHSGRYRLAMLSPSGATVSIRRIEPGDHFGELWVFADAPKADYHLIADSSGQLLEMAGKDVIRLGEAIPEFSRYLMRSIAKLAISQAARIYEFSCLGAGGRLQAELLRLADAGKFEDRVVIDPAPTHAAIASQIGTTREGVSRHLRDLTIRGLIRMRRGRIVVLSLRRLRNEVEREMGR